MNIENFGQRFSALVAKILRAEGLDVTTELQFQNVEIDIAARTPSGRIAVIDVKVYRSHIVPASTIIESSHRLIATRVLANAHHAILVIASRVGHLGQEALKHSFPDLIVYDCDNLAFLAAKYPDLLVEFEDFMREIFSYSEQVELRPVPTNIIEDLNAQSDLKLSSRPAPRRTKGRELCEEIRAISPGREGATVFENKISVALKYLFSDDLRNWVPQQSTDTAISRYDLVAKIVSNHDFWRFISTSFRTRFVIFEFKNYGGKIKQGQIYTTEKYLYATALRTVAIIISRSGADANALAASRGALRESGKLILNLSIVDLCNMLASKDRGNDPNTKLINLVDDMLVRLER